MLSSPQKSDPSSMGKAIPADLGCRAPLAVLGWGLATWVISAPMWLQEKLSKGCHTTALASAFVPAVQGLCCVGGNTQAWICLSPRGDRSCTWLSVQPVPSGGTRCRQYTLGIWLWDALLQVLGCPSCIWGLDCLIQGSRVSVGYCWFSCYWGRGGPEWRGSAVGSVRTHLPPSCLSLSAKL